MKIKPKEKGRKILALKRTFGIIMIIFLFNSCGTQKQFSLSKTKPAILPEKVTGTVAIVYLENKKKRPLRGELIAVTNQEIILNCEQGLTKMPLDSCSHIKLLISKAVNNRSALTAWAVALPFTTVIHGLISAYTFPLNVIVVVPTIVAINSNYKALYPDQMSKEVLAIFARFPQGMPEGFKIN
ncbi:MAG: hypothetical protein H0W62_13055 [Chitinophagales bacterium]|nr:hypothetical protein [Chitinophagales bacterium]